MRKTVVPEAPVSMSRPFHTAVLVTAGAALLSLSSGCQRPSAASPPAQGATAPSSGPPTVQVVKPERKTVHHPIEQPGFNIEAFQETPLYAKISGYVREWKKDIGDSVHKDDLLAELSVPEMDVDVQQKEAAISQAEAQVKQAQAAVRTAQAQVERTKSQYERMQRVGQQGVVDRDTLEETHLGYEVAQAGLDRAQADLKVAQAQVKVAQANLDYAHTMLHYRQIRAPFDGVVTQRNVNTGDFVQPAATGTRGQPLYVVDQFDPVRVFVNVPGADAAWVRNGDPVSLRLQGAGGELFQGKVTRNARALNPQERTLRVEIDVPNPQGKLLPGSFVQTSITVDHPNVWTLPAAAVATEGDQTFCFRVEDGKAVRTPLQVGLRGGGLVEVLKKQVQAPLPGEQGRWQDITGNEGIVTGDQAHLSEGQPVGR